jgi:hypothetical protein
VTTTPAQPVLAGPTPDPDELYANFRPIRYRYVMAHLHDHYEEVRGSDGKVIPGQSVLRKAGEVIDVLPMTGVSYGVGLYAGTTLGGQIFLPDFYLDQMPHPPANQFERLKHPYQEGAPIGAKFECGNRAIYVMRNEEVVWGGILWTREYSSGSATMSLSAMSWDAYIYYRLIRATIAFNGATNIYKIWYAVLKQLLTDFTWPGVPNGVDSHHNPRYKNSGMEGQDAHRHAGGESEVDQRVPWTGLTRTWYTTDSKGKRHRHDQSQAVARRFQESWQNNSPDIRLPPNDLLWKRGDVEVKGTKTFHGYDMQTGGEALQQWADTDTLMSSHTKSGLSRFEYRVVCWFDQDDQVFRQRYIFGEMTYAADGSAPNIPTGIKRPLIGNKTHASAEDPARAIIFDFPGHIAEWSLGESMEDGITRAIAVSGESDAAKHVAYSVQDDLLKVPNKKPPYAPAADTGADWIGTQGWLLYDKAVNVNMTAKDKKPLEKLADVATRYRNISHVPQAVRIDDLVSANHPKNPHASHRCTDLSVTLYQTPNQVFPDWTLGDWVTFAIEDPFYGGKMYIVRRIIGYTVTVLPDQESDYSHERIELTLTDDTKKEVE